ncbi:MAG TPA: BTAD domain-containing putative transcriptional regulator [Ktedonosporobacter sp.]|jgi:ATP/maltotriose-dependent transcriptional regulator MalT|nr:BTAD domain-containing putative transcriptional regulator [Ktedonosporobacter sp.]
MSTARISHKHQKPTLPSTTLHREEIIQALADAIEPRDSAMSSPHKLVLLCASAGYGKTTLLVDTVNRLSSRCCWYILDDSDADPAIFLQRLLASIQYCLPAFGRQLTTQLEESNPETEERSGTITEPENFFDALLDALKNEIPQRFVLILCNYHEVNQSETINKLVNRLIAYLPPQGTVVIESQAMPNLMLVPLIARHQMFGMGNDGLRFSAQEVYDLARLQGITTLSLQEAEQLAASFEGWIAGIMLGSCVGYSQFRRPDLPASENWCKTALIGDDAQLLAYVTNEVFKHETATCEFLKKTSILTRLSPERCNALLAINDAAEQLAYAEQRGLFVVRDRENKNAGLNKDYICHPVLRQLFSDHLRSQCPTYYRTLHSQAAHLLLADRQHEQALTHACQAQEYTLAVNIILDATSSINYEEHSAAILRWLEMLPEEIFKQSPRLLLIASNIHLRLGEFSLVPPLLDSADALLKAGSPEQNHDNLLNLQAELSIARGHLLFFHGDFGRTRELCQHALELLPPSEHHLHIRAYQYLGISLIVGSGQVQDGIAKLQLALQMSRTLQNEAQIATLHRLIANAYSWIGNHALAEHHQMRAFQIWEKQNNTTGIIYSLSSLGLLKMRQGFTQEAGELLQRALYQARDVYHFKSGEAYALAALGDLHNSLGQYTEALTYLEDGLNLARHCEDRYLTYCSLCNLAMTYLFMDDTQTAQFFLNQIFFKEGENNSFEKCLFHLTQGTVYLFQQDYKQAESTLEYTADITRRANIQIIYINALLRLIVCYLRQGQKRAALPLSKCLIDLNKKGDFDFFLQIESKRYPELQPFLDQATGTKNAAAVTPQVPQEQQTPSGVTVQVLPGQQDVSSLQILALGEPKVLLNGTPITRWRMARTLELFFLLLENRAPMRKDQISLALWPENDNQLDSTVRTTIYYLRKALGENCLIFQSGLYRLNLASIGGGTVWYDVEIFNEQYSQAKKALKEKADEIAVAALTKMVDLYHGDYLQPFYNDWCSFRRDKLRQAYMDARHQLALIAWRREDWESSMQHWTHLLIVDPCHEAAHYGIMRCYLQQGKREQALRQFQRCRQNLQDELHTTPGTSLQKLYRSLTSTVPEAG